MVDAHKITERTSLLYHEVYADLIEKDGTCLGRALAVIENEVRSNGGTVGERMWQLLLKKPWNQIRKEMLADTPDGRLLRSNSPFSIIIGVSDLETRRLLWRKAKLSVVRTFGATRGVD